MSDMVFEEIKAAFLDNFDNCKVENLTTELLVEFDNKQDAKWFETYVVYPTDNPEDSPIDFNTSIEPIGDKIVDSPIMYQFTFKVKNKDKLIKILRNLKKN